MKNFYASFMERHIWRVLLAYPSVTFIWLQVVEFFINNYGFDERLLTVSIVAAVLFFPAAVIWNWRHGEVGAQAFAKSELAAYAVFAIVAAMGSAWYWNATPASTRVVAHDYEPARTVAVMPFENAGNNAEVQFLCDGIAESLINWLATIPDVKVISKSAAFRLRAHTNDTARLAETLGVDGVIRGRLEQVGDQVVISTSFVDTRDNSQLWGERLVRPANEVLYLERSIVDSIKDGLLLEVSDSQTAISASGGTDDPAAYEHYMRGHYLIQSTNSESLEEGVSELRQAIRIDPKFARPYADIADALYQMISYGVDRQELLLNEARSAAYTAVALAPDLPEAHTALATIKQYFDFDWVAVDAAYEAAIALEPQSPVPYNRYTVYLVLSMRTSQARDMAARAIAIDSLDAGAMHAVGLAAMFSQDYPAAVKAFGDWNQFHTNSRWSYVKHSLALSLNGQCDLARQQATIALELMDGHPPSLMDSWIAWGFMVCGDEEHYAMSKARIDEKLRASPDMIDPAFLYLHALEGDTDSLVDLIGRIFESGHQLTPFVSIFQIDYLGWATSDTMPTDPRYLAILEKLDFPASN